MNLIEVEAKNFVLYIGHLGRREPVVQPTISRMKEVELKRIISLLAVMALMAAILAMTASAGFAAINCQKSTGDISSCQGGSGSGYTGGGGGSGGGGQLTFDYSNPDNPAFTQKGGSGGGSRGGDGGGSGSNCSGTIYGDYNCTGRKG